MSHALPSLDALRAAAFAVRDRAYAPYSRFRVGAAVATADGRTFVGCNVENAAYGATLCAERAALVAAVAAGVSAGAIERVVVATDASAPTPPCGSCRQVLAELAPAAQVISYAAAGAEARWTVAELLPNAFTPAALPLR